MNGNLLNVDELLLYRGKDCKINTFLTIKQPKLEDICEYGENKYFGNVTKLCSTPTDMRVELYDNFNLWWDEVDDFDLFTLIYKSFSDDDTRLFLSENISLQRMEVVRDNVSDDIKLFDFTTGAYIDRFLYEVIVTYLRRCHGLKKNYERGGNKITKQFLIEEDRDKRELALKNKKENSSILLPMISALTNHPNFKYRFDDVWQMPIYAFMDAAKRIQVIDSYSNIMHGYYSGCVDLKKIGDKQKLNWMRDLKE
jgi:hypothetical protein